MRFSITSSLIILSSVFASRVTAAPFFNSEDASAISKSAGKLANFIVVKLTPNEKLVDQYLAKGGDVNDAVRSAVNKYIKTNTKAYVAVSGTDRHAKQSLVEGMWSKGPSAADSPYKKKLLADMQKNPLWKDAVEAASKSPKEKAAIAKNLNDYLAGVKGVSPDAFHQVIGTTSHPLRDDALAVNAVKDEGKGAAFIHRDRVRQIAHTTDGQPPHPLQKAAAGLWKKVNPKSTVNVE